MFINDEIQKQNQNSYQYSMDPLYEARVESVGGFQQVDRNGHRVFDYLYLPHAEFYSNINK